MAEYKPNSYSKPFKIIKKQTFEETKRATIAAMRGGLISPANDDHRQYDPYERPNPYEQRSTYDQRPRTANSVSLAKSDTPIIDALCGDVPISLKGRDEVITTILKNIKARRNHSSKVREGSIILIEGF